ncbi:MAG: putative glycoside hydrolase [Gaiellales bacterium]
MICSHARKGFVALAITLGAGIPISVQPATAAPASSPAFASTSSGLHLFSGIQGDVGHNFTTTELTGIARQSDVVVGLAIQLKQYAATLRAVKPSIQLYVYTNGMFGQAKDCGSYPSSWKLHTSSGATIVSKTNKNCLMNPYSTQSYGGHAGWTAQVVATCKADLAAAPAANGCFLDQMSAVGVSNFVSGMPVDPLTGKSFTTSQYLAAVAKVGNSVASVASVIGNSYESGRKYFTAPTSQLDSSNMQSFEAEHWLGSTQPRDAETLSVWQQSIQMLIDSQAHGKTVLASFGDMSSNLSQWEAFNVASVLLGNNGHALLHFDGGTQTQLQLDGPILHMSIGTPTETHSTVGGYLQNGVYQRTYSSGLVLVNPGGKSVTVKLSHTYVTPGGQKVSQVTLSAYSGTVLKG